MREGVVENDNAGGKIIEDYPEDKPYPYFVFYLGNCVGDALHPILFTIVSIQYSYVNFH